MAEVRFEKCRGEIKITPQMIHAGQSILEAIGEVSLEDRVVMVYRAMRTVEILQRNDGLREHLRKIEEPRHEP